MNEKQINELLSALHDGELTGEERRQAEEYLRLHPEAAAQFALIGDAVRGAATFELSPSFTADVMAQLGGETREDREWLPAERFGLRLVTGMAVCVLAVAVLTRFVPAGQDQLRPEAADRSAVADTSGTRLYLNSDDVQRYDEIYAVMNR